MNMMRLYKGTILVVAILSSIFKWNENTLNKNQFINEGKVVKETMSASFYVDPTIDFSSEKIISIIIEFKIKPAKIAVQDAEAEGKQLTLEEATKNVEESHEMFQKELKTLLDDHQVPYTIRRTYKTVLNGVSMELPAKEIKRLQQSTVIEKIYPNRKVHLFPSITPFNQM
ncbi:protease inhibitor I9 family protein [Bacillus sp. EAC]|uniref:protease inhibitor I9 family protein n=1 Tax=Bacillus sp. EAC TaxID=1978338 RepID=UPI00211B70AD|nr:protease inhibitor I9 family protein [Bacillus sp. EAC]